VRGAACDNVRRHRAGETLACETGAPDLAPPARQRQFRPSACVLFNSMAAVRKAHVPYKRQGPSLTDLIAGHV